MKIHIDYKVVKFLNLGRVAVLHRARTQFEQPSRMFLDGGRKHAEREQANSKHIEPGVGIKPSVLGM